MSKLTAYLIGGQPLGDTVEVWSSIDLSGNVPFKIEEIVSSGYQDISSIENFDNFGILATNDCSLIYNGIKSLYDATTFSSLNSIEREIVSRWFVSSKSERDSVKTEDEQEVDAIIITDCLEQNKNNDVVISLIASDGVNPDIVYNNNVNVNHDRAMITTNSEESMTSKGYVDVPGLLYVTKDLGTSGTYLINVAISRKHSSSNVDVGFIIEVNGDILTEQIIKESKNKISVINITAVAIGVTSGSIIKVLSKNKKGKHTVLNRTMTVDGIIDSRII